MFVYLSFLRPPPLHAKPNVQIAFNAQIANDLRTELWKDPVDVYYHWISPSSRTRNEKLFTWKQKAAYKILSVNPPPITSNNRKWALCLNTRVSVSSDSTINLLGSSAEILPVLSVPIQFELSSSKSPSMNWDWEKKSEEIERVYCVDGDSQIVIREKTSYDLDKVPRGNRIFPFKFTNAQIENLG
jgi:protein N-lysine methyltransferase METTL21D